MHFLVDTHILLWALYSPEKLPEDIRIILEGNGTHIEYSIVSLWEIEIKHGKFPTQFDFTGEVTHEDAQSAGLHMMKLEPYHISNLERLNKPKKKHKDPFDRMLMAQAKYENVYLLTHDKRLTDYGEECVCYF